MSKLEQNKGETKVANPQAFAQDGTRCILLKRLFSSISVPSGTVLGRTIKVMLSIHLNGYYRTGSLLAINKRVNNG